MVSGAGRLVSTYHYTQTAPGDRMRRGTCLQAFGPWEAYYLSTHPITRKVKFTHHLYAYTMNHVLLDGYVIHLMITPCCAEYM